MNKLKNILTIILFFTFLYVLFKYNYILNISVIDGVNLWLYKIFPSLFIMFILNNIIINTNLLHPLIKYTYKPFNKIFNTSGNSSLAFFLSIFSGTPSSAFILKEMIETKEIDYNSANKLISFTYFSNPLFLYNILSLTFNKYITIKIIIIHYISNIFIGLFLRNKKQSYFYTNTTNKINFNFISILPNAIKKSLDTLIMILGTVVFYLILTNLITNIFNFNLFSTILIKGLFEITQSLNILNTLQNVSIIKEIIAISIISFGGLAIHTQVLSLINNTNISYKNFFIGRILHVLISASTYIFITTCTIS